MKKEQRETLEDLEESQVLEFALAFLAGKRKGPGTLAEFTREFGGLVLPKGPEADRFGEIDSILRDYAARSKPKRPLCIAVFGPPGSGKSFGLEELLKAQPDNYAEPTKVNLSQVTGPEALASTFIDLACKAGSKFPVLFIDEFDCTLDGEELGWLRWFLAPMQDSRFFHEGKSIPIGKAVFAFAGGTAASRLEFEKRASEDQVAFRAKKVPDFLSRLRGFIDIGGINVGGNEGIVRRALVLDHMLRQRSKKLVDEGGGVRVDKELLRSLLTTAHFIHGVRSLEAVLDMSRLSEAEEFTEKLLPSQELRRLHLSCGPLDGKKIGISTGFKEPVDGLFRSLSRELLVQGARIVYGGDPVPSGTLHQVVAAANELPGALIRSEGERIRNYLAFPSYHNLTADPGNRSALKGVDFRELPTLSEEEAARYGVELGKWFPAIPEGEPRDYDARKHVAWAVSLFRMRLRMIEDVDVLVVVGGSDGGSWGRFPGIAEEVMLALAMRKPVYVLGGAGGAAQAVGRLLGLDSAAVDQEGCLRETATAAFNTLLAKSAHSFTASGMPALPLTLQELRQYLFDRGVTTPAWRWNGLDLNENRELFSWVVDGEGSQKCVKRITLGLSRLHWHP